MKTFFLIVIGLFTLSRAMAADALMEKVDVLEQHGQFKEAAALLNEAIPKTDSSVNRKKLEFERDRLDRIKKDYPLSPDALFTELKHTVKDLTREEFDGASIVARSMASVGS
jgi:hypothetical protein